MSATESPCMKRTDLSLSGMTALKRNKHLQAISLWAELSNFASVSAILWTPCADKQVSTSSLLSLWCQELLCPAQSCESADMLVTFCQICRRQRYSCLDCSQSSNFSTSTAFLLCCNSVFLHAEPQASNLRVSVKVPILYTAWVHPSELWTHHSGDRDANGNWSLLTAKMNCWKGLSDSLAAAAMRDSRYSQSTRLPLCTALRQLQKLLPAQRCIWAPLQLCLQPANYTSEWVATE